MAIRTVDASAVAAIIFAEPDAAQVVTQIAGCALTAPTILGYELANICATKMRRNPLVASAVRRQYSSFTDMHIEAQEVDIDDCLRLAHERSLSVYDASYLWLARVTGSILVTLDRKLAQAAAHG